MNRNQPMVQVGGAEGDDPADAPPDAPADAPADADDHLLMLLPIHLDALMKFPPTLLLLPMLMLMPLNLLFLFQKNRNLETDP